MHRRTGDRLEARAQLGEVSLAELVADPGFRGEAIDGSWIRLDVDGEDDRDGSVSPYRCLRSLTPAAAFAGENTLRIDTTAP